MGNRKAAFHRRRCRVPSVSRSFRTIRALVIEHRSTRTEDTKGTERTSAKMELLGMGKKGTIPVARQTKYLPTGEPNPNWKQRPSEAKLLADDTPNPNYRKKPNGAKPPSKWVLSDFIAWDGEGATVNGEHRYILLANSRGDYLYNPEGIPTKQALSLLTECGKKYPRSIHVIFSGGYDVNMLLRDVPRSSIQELWDSRAADRATVYDEYDLTYVPHKQFTVRRWKVDVSGKRQWTYRNYKWHPVYQGNVVLWDVFGFFQSSFVRALEKHLPTFPHLSTIKEGKERRSQFGTEEKDYILRYCRYELDALVLLMQKIRKDLEEAGLVVARWDGAGAIAAKLMQVHGIKHHKADCGEGVNVAAQYAYSGGRIEVIQYGYHKEKVWKYDINSAYPAAMLSLPSLSQGRWVHSPNLSKFSLYKVEYSFDMVDHHTIMPFFHRTKNGAIVFPYNGCGWYWYPEYKAAKDALWNQQITGEMKVLDGYSFLPSQDNVRPFSFLPELFEQRKRWKEEGNDAQLMLKLGINSLYGKMVQQVGARNGEPPTYHQLEWGGYITSTCRARLFSAAIAAKDHIIMFCTDGVFSTTPLDLKLSDELGDWSLEILEGLLVVQSGVYFMWPNPEKNNHYRGFDQGSISPKKVLTAWKRKKYDLQVPLTRFVTMGSALASDEQWQHWRTWRTVDRELELSPWGSKRIDIAPSGGSVFPHQRPDLGLVPTWPNQVAVPPGSMSSIYPLEWCKPVYSEIDGVDERIVRDEITEDDH